MAPTLRQYLEEAKINLPKVKVCFNCRGPLDLYDKEAGYTLSNEDICIDCSCEILSDSIMQSFH